MPRPSQRLAGLPGFSIDRVAAAAEGDPEVLRLENLDTDLRPHPSAVAATKAAVDDDAWNSYLPFTGAVALREAICRRVARLGGPAYDTDEVCITCGGTEAAFDALLGLIDPGDEVVLADPTYAGLVNRVKLAGGVPRFAPLVPSDAGWTFDAAAFRAALSPKTKAVLFSAASMPAGCVLTRADWEAVAAACKAHDLWLIHDAAMERLLYDGRHTEQPASLPGMRERTVIVGSASKDLRLIGWRIGWAVGPREAMANVSRAHIYNAVCPPGFNQAGALAALEAGEGDVQACVHEWQLRRDTMLEELRGLPVVPPHGGWSMLLDTTKLGLSPAEASKRLLAIGKVAATPMTGWGDAVAARFVRFVFSNERVARLRGLGEKVRRSLSVA